MDTKILLEQILNSTKDLAAQGRDKAEQRLGVPEAGPERDAMLSGMGKGALAAGALVLLLGTGAGRRLTGTALKLGSLAAIGGLAYKGYQNWQANQAGTQTDPGTRIDELAGSEAADRSLVLLKAMIAAANADGHIDEAERRKIEDQISTLGLESDVARFIQDEMRKPRDVAAIASDADSVEAAAEIYLASRVVIDVNNESERVYLDQLAKALNLAPELVSQLEDQVSA